MLGYGIKQQSATATHKEATASRVEKDKNAINEICEVIKE